MDRRGRGESGDGPAYSLDREAEDVAVLVDSIRQPVNVLGHSYGALCAIKAALLTNNIRRLILYEGVPARGIDLYRPGIIDEMQKLIDSGKTEDALVMMFREVVNMPEDEIHLLRTKPSWKRRVANANIAAREMREEQKFVFDPSVYGKITIPTLLLVGGESPSRELANAQVVASALTKSRIQILAGQQHAAMYTSPDLFVKEVIAFLTKP